VIIRDLSRHCRAAKIAGCRLRGQEIVAATAAGGAARVSVIVRCRVVSKRF